MSAQADGNVLQCNEGHWDFSLQDSDAGSHIILDVAIGKYLDSSLISADIQPHVARLLIKVILLNYSFVFVHLYAYVAESQLISRCHA